MTEAEWNECEDQAKMLEFLWNPGRSTDRKARLLCTAFFRQVWDQLPSETHRQVIELGERFADGLARASELYPVRDALQQQKEKAVEEQDFEQAVWHLYCETPVTEIVWSFSQGRVKVFRLWTVKPQGCAIIRDIFGPLPFRKVIVDPAWLAWNNETVRRLAEAAYAQRTLPAGTLDGVRLAVLADALEEAGCSSQEILEHLRGPKAHVRGCWAIDLLTGRK